MSANPLNQETTHVKNGRTLLKSYGQDGGGTYAHVVEEDDDGNVFEGFWYGTTAECLAVDPFDITLQPMTGAGCVDPFDLACERRFD